ncbi:MAG TPA: AbrB/MazE/SpoVT family DNA-binding domain-containing protein [Roseomonas sp.]|nr:AbrB/MazE/SpoVT family DNA-binding domain-containing protein [Roseomonas sp.]
MPDVIARSKVAKWGNSAAVRLPAATLEKAQLCIDDSVDLIAQQGEVVIRKQRPQVTMAELLARFDPEKHRHPLHLDVPPVGGETR